MGTFFRSLDEVHAAMWDDGEVTPLGDFRFCSSLISRAFDIDDAGDVVGTWTHPRTPGGECSPLPILWRTRHRSAR